MKDEDISLKPYEPWIPIKSPRDIKTLGKLIEELGELQAACARCLIQGVDGLEPVTGYPNVKWLEDEIADVLLNIGIVLDRFNLDTERIDIRASKKAPLIIAWIIEG